MEKELDKTTKRRMINMAVKVQDTIEQNMASAIPLLYPVALMNTDSKLRALYADVERGHAVAGFRRDVANFGTMLVRATYGSNNKINVAPLGESKVDDRTYNGVYDYITKDYQDNIGGILGQESRDGSREIVNASIADKYISDMRDITEMRYEVSLSPGTINRFLASRIKRMSGGNWRDCKINLEFTAGLPQGTALAMAEKRDNKIIMVTKVPSKAGGPKLIYSFVDEKNSRVHELQVQPGRVYLIRPISFDKQTGKRTVNVLRQYKEGIRMAIQKFKMGVIRPGDKAYDVNPDKTNGISEETVMDMPFFPNQNIKFIQRSPMLVFDADMIAALMLTLSGYPEVRMKFKDASSGVYFVAKGNEYMPTIEAAVGPTIQWVRGRVCLP